MQSLKPIWQFFIFPFLWGFLIGLIIYLWIPNNMNAATIGMISGVLFGIYNNKLRYQNWTPSPDNINHLPLPIRDYIHNIETNCDPAYQMQENFFLRETIKGLLIQINEDENDE